MLNWQNLKLIVAVWVSTVFIKKKKKEKRLEMITRIMWKFLSNASHEWKLMKVKFITAVFACEQVLWQGGGGLGPTPTWSPKESAGMLPPSWLKQYISLAA